jgi:hypothetical protein
MRQTAVTGRERDAERVTGQRAVADRQPWRIGTLVALVGANLAVQTAAAADAPHQPAPQQHTGRGRRIMFD